MSRQLVAKSICFSLLLSLLPLRNSCFSAFSGWPPSVWVQYSHGSHLPSLLGHCFLIMSSVLSSLSSLFLPPSSWLWLSQFYSWKFFSKPFYYFSRGSNSLFLSILYIFFIPHKVNSKYFVIFCILALHKHENNVLYSLIILI